MQETKRTIFKNILIKKNITSAMKYYHDRLLESFLDFEVKINVKLFTKFNFSQHVFYLRVNTAAIYIQNYEQILFQTTNSNIILQVILIYYCITYI